MNDTKSQNDAYYDALIETGFMETEKQAHTRKTLTDLIGEITARSEDGVFKIRERVSGWRFVASSTSRGMGYFGEGETPSEAITVLAERMGVAVDAD